MKKGKFHAAFADSISELGVGQLTVKAQSPLCAGHSPTASQNLYFVPVMP